MRKSIALAIALGSFLLSCNKEEDNTMSYLPLSIGNYWIYQQFQVDTTGNETLNPIPDSVIIIRDTLIHNKKYYVFEGNCYPNTRYLRDVIGIFRDSSGYIVNQNGTILFAANDFRDSLAYKVEINPGDINDTGYVSVFRMERIVDPITVPAGTFTVLNCKGTVNTSKNTPGVKYPRYLKNYYSEGVGRIVFTCFYFQSPVIYEKRLLRYHIN